MSSTHQDSAHLSDQSRVYGPETWTIYERLDRSLDPAGPALMEAVAAPLLANGARILDAGCGDSRHLIRLLEANPGTTGIGVEPVAGLIESARCEAGKAALGERLDLIRAALPELPLVDGRIDLAWCRDVLEVIQPLEAAVAEIGRVLRSGGHLLVYTVFATELLEAGERAMLRRHRSALLENLDEERVEAAFSGAGLAIADKRVIGTEWREYAEERTQPASMALLRLARLRRQRDQIIEASGLEIFEHVEANLHWLVWQFLGKLRPTVYLLVKR